MFPHIYYRSKVKLHGTNAGIQIRPNGQVVAQSRKKFITPGDDNMGFAKWVAEHENQWKVLANPAHTLTIFGEWCGKGIAKGVAISQLDRKIFAVFAIQEDERILVEPYDLGKKLDSVLQQNFDVHVLHWEDFDIWINWDEDLTEAANLITNEVARVETEDPWVKEIFNISGIGEGLVFYPYLVTDKEGLGRLMFKAKGERHQNVKGQKAAQLEPANAENVNAFVKMVLTEARLEQGLTEACKGQAEKRMIGPFLKWINQDIQKECQDELEASGLTFKDVNKILSETARGWLLEKEKL